jgi:hypothetical protein
MDPSIAEATKEEMWSGPLDKACISELCHVESLA